MFSRLASRLAIISFIFMISAIHAHAASEAKAEKKDLKNPAYSLGKADAPVTLIEYASYTCSHCANFHNNVLPKVIKDWVDTGKVRVEYVDFPLDEVAMGISMLTYCAPPEKYHALRDAFFARQSQWVQSKNMRLELFTIAREVGGLSEPESAKCLNNTALLNQLREQQAEAAEKYQVNATPSFTINGSMVRGMLPYEEFSKRLSEGR